MTLHCRKKLFLATFSSFVLLHPAIAQNASPTATEENSSDPINNKTTNTQQNTNSDKTQQKNEKTPDTAKNTKAAPDNGSGSASGAYELGKVIVFANNREWGQTAGETISQSTVSSEDIRVYNRNSLDDALKIVPGVTIQNTGAMRNEQKYYIRGFDMDQAPLLIDGIQVYLPYDNGLDTGRFLTPDLAEIQVQKGYVSVLNGPGGMGGEVNLVTRKPTKALEGELRPTIDIGNTGSRSAYLTSGYVGTKQDGYYLMASGAYRDSDGFFMSRHYNPLEVAGAVIEDGGRRDNSGVRDWRGNFKVGFTPNETDEYTINYTKQEGRKDLIYAVDKPVDGLSTGGKPSDNQRNWKWPDWNVETVSGATHTEIGSQSYVNTRLYYAAFDNTIDSYDDYHFDTQIKPKSFTSTYHDKGWGGSIEGGTELIPMNTLKAALHYRRDEHQEYNFKRPDLKNAIADPITEDHEDVMSAALENTFHATDTLDLVGGVSYDYRDLKRADYVVSGTRNIDQYKLTNDDAVNWQFAAINHITPTGEIHASVSSRTRFPTLKDRFSARFGSAVPNPNLKAERATNYEIGWSDLVTADLKLGAALFYNDIDDMIDGVYLGIYNDDGKEMAQNRNVGSANYKGVELNFEWQATESASIGGNYTFMHGHIDSSPSGDDIKVTNKPENKAFIYGKMRVIEKLNIVPSLEYNSSRYNQGAFQKEYRKTDAFVLGNISVEYEINKNSSITGGVRNISDENYQVQAGFPEAGRTYFISGRVTF